MGLDRRRLLTTSLGMLAAPACSQPRRATVRPEDFGATGGDDDTAAIQRMADAAAAAGQRIDAGGRSYQVDNVFWPGGTRLSHIRLVLRPGDSDDRSPVAIGRHGKITRDLIFDKVIVDGNRAAQEHVGRSGYADGARSGFQIRGRVEQVVIRNCQAVNCATDGVMIFSDLQHGADDRPILRDIMLLNVIASDNRRHGLSADAFDNLNVVSCILSRNGADLKQGIASDHGLAAARFNGAPYGRPFDIEDYLVGTGWSRLRIADTDCRGNRTGALVYSQVSPDSPGFVPRRGLWIARCRFDELGGSRWDPPLGIAQMVDYRGQRPTFRDVTLVDNIFDNGPLRISGVDGLSVRGGRITVTKPNETEPVIVANCRRISITPGHA